jgi:hypothetical protein
MTRPAIRHNFAFVSLVVAASLCAQQPTATAPPATTGQVTGRVFCADTGQPGRFAGVQLIGDQQAQAPMIDPSTLGKDADFEKVMAKAMTAVMKGNSLSTVTSLDGSFSLDKVPPGTYYVVAQLPGYQSPLSGFSQLEKMKADDATLKAVESAAEKIVVQANQPAHVDIRLERGASINGIIHYDDGSPAPNVTPTLLALQKDGKWKELSASSMLPSTSDDRGRFRFFGMPAGKYAVKAALPTSQAMIGLGAASLSLHMNLGDALVVYSGGALREKDVKPIEVGPGEDIDGIDVVFPIDNLHVVSGSVVAKADGHAVDSGTIELDDSETKAALRTSMVQQDGGFQLNYVPEGQYLLRVTTAADTDKAGGENSGGDFARLLHSKTLKSYGPAELPITVKSDSTGLVLQVPDQGTTPAKTAVPSQAPTVQLSTPIPEG